MMCALVWCNNIGWVEFLSLYNVHPTGCGLTMATIKEVYNKDTLSKRLPDDGHGTAIKCRRHIIQWQMFCLLRNCWLKYCIIGTYHRTWKKLNRLHHISYIAMKKYCNAVEFRDNDLGWWDSSALTSQFHP